MACGGAPYSRGGGGSTPATGRSTRAHAERATQCTPCSFRSQFAAQRASRFPGFGGGRRLAPAVGMLPLTIAALLVASPRAPEPTASAPGLIALAQVGVTVASCAVGGGLGLVSGIALAAPGSYGAGTALGAVVGSAIGLVVGCGLSPLFANLVGSAMGGRGTFAGAMLGLLGGVLTGAALSLAAGGLWPSSPGLGGFFAAAVPLAVLAGPAVGYAISAPPLQVSLVPLAGEGAGCRGRAGGDGEGPSRPWRRAAVGHSTHDAQAAGRAAPSVDDLARQARLRRDAPERSAGVAGPAGRRARRQAHARVFELDAHGP